MPVIAEFFVFECDRYVRGRGLCVIDHFVREFVDFGKARSSRFFRFVANSNNASYCCIIRR